MLYVVGVIVVTFVGLGVVIYAICVVYITLRMNRIMFHPIYEPLLMTLYPLPDPPQRYNLLGYHETHYYLQSPDNHIIHTRISVNSRNKVTIFFCHGNKGVIKDYEKIAPLFQCLGVNYVVFDYAGYGQSRGNLSLQGIRNDALCAYRFVEDFLGPYVVVVGHSLGGIPTTFIAQECKPYKVMLVNTMSKMSHVLKAYPLYSFLALTIDSLTGIDNIKPLQEYSTKWKSAKEVPKGPPTHDQKRILILHSRNDALLPFSCAVYMAQAVPEAVLLPVEGTHAMPMLNEDQFNKVLEFWGIDKPTMGRQKVIYETFRHGIRMVSTLENLM